MCQSMCSEALLSTNATTRVFTVLLSDRFCLQNLLGSSTEAVFVNKGAINKVKLIKNKGASNKNKM